MKCMHCIEGKMNACDVSSDIAIPLLNYGGVYFFQSLKKERLCM